MPCAARTRRPVSVRALVPLVPPSLLLSADPLPAHHPANADVSDFLYSCLSHLSDPGVSPVPPLRIPAASPGSVDTTGFGPQFARPAPSAISPSSTPSTPSPPSVPQSEIDKVKAKYEERQRRKASSSPAPAEAKSWLSTGLTGISSLASSTKDLLLPPLPPPEPTTPTGPAATVFVLHRDIFAMRVAGKKRSWQAKEAKERAKQLALPAVPRGGLGAGPPGGL